MLLVTSQMQAQAEAMLDALQGEEIDRARQFAGDVSPLRAARILVEAPKRTLIPFLESLPLASSGAIVANLPPELAGEVLDSLPQEIALDLMGRLPPEFLAEIGRELPREQKAEFLGHLETAQREQVEALLVFDEDQAGAVMSTQYLAVELGTTVGQIMEAVRSGRADISNTAYIYVVRTAGQLKGVVSLRELVMHKSRTPVEDVMVSDVFAARTTDDAVDAAQRMRTRQLKMMPVVDDQDVLYGVITVDKAMDLLALDVADEFVSINAGSPDESFFTPPRQAVKGRLPWMASNIFLNLGAVWVISSFEATLVQVAILAAFLPMITDMGGNVGIQALSVSIRSMALGEARLGDVWKAVHKETIVGLINGLALGLLFSILAFAIQGNVVLGIVAGLALGINVLVASLVGGTLPFLIKRFGKDPAMMTGPVLTTITDITGVTIYLGLSTLFLASLMATGMG